MTLLKESHAYLDCRFMFVQMRAMSAYHGAFSSNPALAPAVKRPAPIFSGCPLTGRHLDATMMRTHFDGVHTPGVRTHGRPAHRNRAHPRLRRDAASSAALL